MALRNCATRAGSTAGRLRTACSRDASWDAESVMWTSPAPEDEAVDADEPPVAGSLAFSAARPAPMGAGDGPLKLLILLDISVLHDVLGRGIGRWVNFFRV